MKSNYGFRVCRNGFVYIFMNYLKALSLEVLQMIGLDFLSSLARD